MTLDQAAQHKTITWVDPRPQALEALTMSGLDYLQAMIDGKFPAPPIASHINLELASVSPGVATMTATPGLTLASSRLMWLAIGGAGTFPSIIACR